MHYFPTHIFHFVTISDMKKQLQAIAKKEMLTLSVLIRNILFDAVPCMESCQYNFEDAGNEGEEVGADAEIYAEIPLELMKRIRFLKWQCNVFSSAIIVRRILARFLELAGRLGLAGAREFLRRYRRRFRSRKKKCYKNHSHMLGMGGRKPLLALEIGQNLHVLKIKLRE